MAMVDPAFTLALAKEIARDACNYYTDNRDYDRFGPRPSFLSSLRNSLRNLSLAILRRRFALTFYDKRVDRALAALDRVQEHVDGLSRLYGLLADACSKDLLVKLMTFRILGYRRVKLPRNTRDYWQKCKSLRKLIVPAPAVPAGSLGWNLLLFRLHDLGYDVEVFSAPLGILHIFVLKQYELMRAGVSCRADPGDFAIDAGACWGDSSLYLASAVGKTGKVYAFEFLPANLEIVQKNLNRNPQLRERIELVEKPLWDVSGQPLYCIHDGPSSRVTAEPPEAGSTKVTTLSLDDFVEKHHVPRVDFIKMDIEGAEVNALRGAVRTIQRFRPKLAISVYHALADFATIPTLLSSLGVEYDFYLDHYTVHIEETVLYGVPRSAEQSI